MATPITIAIQGGPASFHDAAARQLFATDAVKMLSCSSFEQLCDVLQQGQADFAVMAIENLLAGSIRTNYTLLQQYDFSILEELWLPIDQNLIALPGQRIQDITSVRSHPVALLQCSAFLEQHPHLQAQETTDTADSARDIRGKQQYGVAAIAGRQAAQLYGLEILKEHIADQQANYTRFLLLTKAKHTAGKTASANKASLLLELPLAAGSLEAVMQELHTLHIHTSLIQSVPGSSQHVAIDVEGADAEELQLMVKELRPLVQSLRVLGLYRRAANPLHPEQQELVSSVLNDNN